MTSAIASFEGEIPGYPKGKWDTGYFYGVRKVIVGWADRLALLQELDTQALGTWPYIDGPSWAIARRAEIDPLGDGQTNATGSQLASYEKAQVTIYYSTKGPRWVNNQLYEEKIEPAAEYHTVNPDKLCWGSAGGTDLTKTESFGRLFYHFDYVQIFHRVSASPFSIQSRVGYTNSNSVVAPQLGMTFAPGTLLFKPPVMSHSVTLSGGDSWDLYIRYGFHPAGWNKVWRQSAMSYQDVYVKGGSQYRNFPSTVF